MSVEKNWAQKRVMDSVQTDLGEYHFLHTDKLKKMQREMQRNVFRAFPNHDIDLVEEAVETVDRVFEKRCEGMSEEERARYMRNRKVRAEMREMRGRAKTGYHYNENGAVIAWPVWSKPIWSEGFNYDITVLHRNSDTRTLVYDVLEKHNIPHRKDDLYPLIAYEILVGSARFEEKPVKGSDSSESTKLTIQRKDHSVDVRYADKGRQWRLAHTVTIKKEDGLEDVFQMSRNNNPKKAYLYTSQLDMSTVNLVKTKFPDASIRAVVPLVRKTIVTPDEEFPQIDEWRKVHDDAVYLTPESIKQNGAVEHRYFPGQFAYRQESDDYNWYYSWLPVTKVERFEKS